MPQLHRFSETVPTGSVLDAMWATVTAFKADSVAAASRLQLLEWLVRRNATGKWALAYTREKLLRDAIASAVTASLLLPQSMSYAVGVASHLFKALLGVNHSVWSRASV